jgi:hypothetical protein
VWEDKCLEADVGSMLIESLILSTLLLLFTNRFVSRARRPVAKTVGLSLAVTLGPCLLFCFFPPVALQGVLISFAVVAWRVSHRSLSFFRHLSLGATLAAYAVLGWFVWEDQRELARLRTVNPYESVEARLPAPKPGSRESPLTIASALRLDRIEAEIKEDVHNSWFRKRQLELLHEHVVGLFVSSPGFGVTRMIRPSARGLAVILPRGPVPRAPGPRVTSAWSPGELVRPPASDEAYLGWMFEDSVEDFVFARGFGYAKDRRHVAGFEPHRFSEVPSPTDRWKMQGGESQFSQVPEPTQRWQVQTLDLIGLLLHDEPVVYVSDYLPRMDEIRAAPTRTLNRFETYGLAALHQGEDLFIARDGEGLRMLGAIRSTTQCVTCHGGERGDLLGAFSYMLRRDGS